jgi:transposase
MTTYVSFDRDQPFLVPPDLKDWLPQDDIAHFNAAAAERVRLGAFRSNPQPGGKPQYHPRLMLSLLVYCYANGIFSSRRIERATHRDVGARFIAADMHPDHDTIATFRRTNKAAFEAAFLRVLLLARESGLLTLGTVSIDGTKIGANASKIRSLRYDRARALRDKLAADIAALTAKAAAADTADEADPQALPAELARREALKAKLDAACGGWRRKPRHKLKPQARSTKPSGRLTRPREGGAAGRPSRPKTARRPDRQINLTDPDSQLMRTSKAHEYRQAYNAQAVVCAEGSQLILATNMATTPSDQPTFAATILQMADTVGLPRVVLADAGFASGPAVAALEAKKIEPLVAIARTQPHRPYDFRPPPPEPKPERRIAEPWRIAMKARLESEDGKARYKKRKQTVEPVFGIIKSAMGFTRFHLRGRHNVAAEWLSTPLAYNLPAAAGLTGPANAFLCSEPV